MSLTINKVKSKIICTGLRVKTFVRQSPLRLHTISKPDDLIVSGHPFSMCWQVSGCYKIVINGHLTLPGSISSVLLDPEQMPEILEIRFFGYDRQLARYFPLHKHKLSFNDPTSSLPSFILPLISLRRKLENVSVKKQAQLRGVQMPPLIQLNAQPNIPLMLIPEVPVLKMHLEPYHLKPTQPEYETTLL